MTNQTYTDHITTKYSILKCFKRPKLKENFAIFYKIFIILAIQAIQNGFFWLSIAQMHVLAQGYHQNMIFGSNSRIIVSMPQVVEIVGFSVMDKNLKDIFVILDVLRRKTEKKL